MTRRHRGSRYVLNQNDEFVRNPCEEDEHKGSENSDNTEENFDARFNELGSVIANHKGKLIYCLTIIGQVEGHYILPQNNKTTKYEHVIPLLMSIEEDERIDGLLVMINTVGGDVEAGLAIAEVIAGMKKPTVSIVLGGGHSIGIPLAVAAKKSYVARSASMTVHPVRTTGLTLGVPQAFEYFQRMQERITNFVVENSAVPYERYMELVMNTGELVMDVGTILDGEDAVEEGLIDEVGTISDAMESLYHMIMSSKKE